MPRRNPARTSLRQYLNELFGRDDRRRQSRSDVSRQPVDGIESLEQRSLLSATPGYVEGDVLLTMQSAETIAEVQDRYPSAELRPLGDYGIYLLRLPQSVSTDTAISDLRNVSGVEQAEPNWVGEWTAVPNDPDFQRLWGLQNTGQTVNGATGTADADIDADLAWDVSTGAASRIVAIVDSGVDYTHPDLADNMWVNAGEIPGNGVDDDGNGFIDDVNGFDTADNDPDPRDFIGHGTHVAGTVGAVGDNGIGLTGVNWNTQLMALKIGTDTGGPTTAGAIAAINYAVQMGASVSNHSYTVTPTTALENAIINAQANNHIVVVAAGNSSLNNDAFPSYPASYPQDNIISVAATNQNDGLAGFSNYGVTSVDIGAPGVNIWSTTPEAGSVFYGPDYDFSDGTSMASPHVAGAVAFLQGLAPSATYDVIIDALYQGADSVASLDGRVSTGARLNVNGAIPFLSPAILTVSPGSVFENAGPSAATITISKSASPISQPLTVDLFFDDPTEVDVPALAGSNTFTIPAGVRSRTFTIDIIDDTLLDGPQIVTFDLQFGGSSIDTTTLTVEDYETVDVTFDRASIKEDAGAGAATLTVTRSNTDVDAPNIWVTAANELREYDSAGTVVNSYPVPWPGGGARPAGEDVHDLQFLQNGRIAVYNGTTSAQLSVFDPANLSWQHYPVFGLSTDAADPATGGIGSQNNWVFLTDTSNGSDPYGAVRLDLTNGSADRFATRSLGDRLFVKAVHGSDIREVDPLTGVTINTIPMPSSQFPQFTGMAFDGTSLWVLAGPTGGNDTIYRLDPDNGAVLDVHHLGGSTTWDGLAYLNGLLYVQDNFIHNQITVYDPSMRRVVDTLDIPMNISGGLAAMTGPDALFATDTFTDEVHVIDPRTGTVIESWHSGMGTEFGVAVLSGEVYVGEFIGAELSVFSRSGVFQRSVSLNLTPPAGVVGLGGDDIQGITPTAYRYRDLSVGLDGIVYVLDRDGTELGLFDPETLQPVLGRDGFMSLSRTVNGIAVDDHGRIFGAGVDGLVYEFDREGNVVQFADPGLSAELTDIDVNIGGAIYITSRDGDVVTTDQSLAAFSSFNALATAPFVSFGKHNTLTSGQAIVNLVNSDPTEIAVPAQLIIPVGEQSVSTTIDAVDDNILDGVQTAQVTATSSGYVGSSDSIDVLDVETIGVEIIPTELPESAGAAATMVRVYRSNVDGPFTYVEDQAASNNVPTTILDRDTVNSYITFPDQTSRVQDVNVELTLTHSWLADLDVFLVSPSGTRVELFTDVLSSEQDMTNTVFDDEARQSILTGMAPFTGSFLPEGSLSDFDGENPSGTWHLEVTDDNRSDFGQLIEWSLTINTLGSEATIVSLSSSDTTEANTVGSVVIPANRSEVWVPLDVFDDNVLDGTQPVTIAVTDSNRMNFEYGDDLINILDDELMTFTVTDTKVSEAGGVGVSTGRVTRFNSDIANPYTVFLSSSDTSELTVPASVTIPAGQTWAEFSIDAVDDAIFDGSQFVTITASAPEYGPDMQVEIEVEDLEPTLSLSTQSLSVSEDASSVTMTVTRLDQSDLSNPQIVYLSSSDTSELAVPAVVTIPAGSASVNFAASVIDDDLLDGTQSVTLTATGPGIGAGSLVLDVLDHETLVVEITPVSFYENARENESAGNTLVGTVTRSNIDDLALPVVVNLVSSDTSEVTVPATVTIPAGEESVSFGLTEVDDPVLDGPQLVTISATATGYVDGSQDVTVLDHEPPVVIGPPAKTQNPHPTIQWQPIAGATRYDLWVDNLSTGVNQIIRDTSILGTTYSPVEALGIGDYRVWVRAYDALEQPGFWSAAYFFRVNTAGTITEPTNTQLMAHSSFPRISWNALADVANYDLWVDNVTTGEQQVIRERALTTTTYLSTAGLGSGTYRAWVRGLNGLGQAGLWSNAATFTVLSAPVISAPSGGTFDRTPTFRWSSVGGATHYDLYISNLTTQSLQYRNLYVTTNQFTMPTDMDGGDYAVWVRAYNGSKFSEWSDVSTFQIALAPSITSPAGGETTGAYPTFVWSGVSSADHYELWVTRMDGYNQRVLYEQSLTTTSFTAGGAFAAGNYRVWVRAVSNMGEMTEWSQAVDFTVAAVESGGDLLPEFDGDQHTLTAVAPVLESTAGTRTTAEQSPRPMNQPVMVAEQTDAVTAAANGDVAAVALHDAVLADWDAADWWNETAAEGPAADSAPVASGRRRAASVTRG